jgi:HEAT repeat protein
LDKVEKHIQRLEDEDLYVRRSAARVLGERGDQRAVEPLTRALEDEDEDVRYWAARALKKIKGK